MTPRRLNPSEYDDAADYLDGRTAALRWLVAFLEASSGSGAANPAWDLWCIAPGPGESPRFSCVVAQFVPTRTMYVAADERADFRLLDLLCEEQLQPSRIIGESGTMDLWSRASPGLEPRARRTAGLEVFAYGGGEEPVPGFRPATSVDLPVLLEYGRLLFEELEEPRPPEIEVWVDHGLIRVVEEAGTVLGMVVSNLCDGKHVHAGGLFVHRAYRGKGVARRLAAGLGAEVLAETGARVILDAYDANLPAIRAYRAAGYEPFGRGRVLWLDAESWDSG